MYMYMYTVAVTHSHACTYMYMHMHIHVHVHVHVGLYAGWEEGDISKCEGGGVGAKVLLGTLPLVSQRPSLMYVIFRLKFNSYFSVA